MADALDFQADFSQLINELLKVNDALGEFDLKAEGVIDVSSKFNAAMGSFDRTLKALTPDGQEVVVVFEAIEAASSKLANIGGPITGALDIVSQKLKDVSQIGPVTAKTLDVGALTDLASSSASSLGGSSGSLTQSNAFSNQIEAVRQAAESAKAPLSELLDLVGKSQGQLANTTGATRDFADALFKLNQTAINTRVGDFAEQVTTKLSAPSGATAQQQGDLTASARAVGDAAAKASLDSTGLNSILNQSTDELAAVTGAYFKVSQAVLNYREEINKFSQAQVDATASTATLAEAQKATANAKNTFFGSTDLSGTNDEVTKASVALGAFQREAEKTGLSESELNKITEDFRNGVVNTDASLSNLNKALSQVQTAQRGLGATQQQAIDVNDKLIQKQQQVIVATAAISQIKAEFPIPASAAPDAIAAYAASLGKLQTQITNSNLSAAEVKSVFDASVAGTGQVFEGEAAKIQNSVNGVISSYGKLSEATGKLSQDMKDFISRVGSQVVTIFTTQLTHAFQQGIVEAQDFSRLIAQSAALTTDAGGSYDKFAEKVNNLSNQFGVARGDLASGLIIALKQHVGDTADALTLLSKATEFSRVSNSSLTDSVTLLSTALNSFGLSASDADHVNQVLFEGIKNGRLSVDSLKEAIGNVGNIARPLGISLEEVVVALDSLTKAGVNAANSQTFLRNFMKALITPTKELQDVFDSYGLANGKAAQETLGLKGVLQLLSQQANGNITETGKLTSNLRAIQATLGLTGENMQTFINNLDKMQKGEKDLAAGTQVTFKNTAQILSEFTENINNTFKKIGSFLLDSSAGIIKAFGGAETAVKTLGAVLVSFSVAVFVANIGTMIAAISALTAVVVANTVAALTNPFVLIGLAIGAVAFATFKAIANSNEAIKRQQENFETIKQQIVTGQQVISDAFKKTVDEQTKLVNVGVASIQQAYHKVSEIIKDEFDETSTHLKNLFDEDVKHRNEAINLIKSEITKAQGEISTLEKEKETGILTIQDRIFEEKLKTLTLTSQIEERDQRAQDLTHAAIVDNANAQKAAANGKIEDSIRFEQVSKREFDDASKQLDKIAQATLKVKDLSAGYTTTLIDFIKKDFELETKLINETEKDVLDSFKRVKDAVKDIKDKTGDFSGDSTKFLTGVTKQLTSYLNLLRGANGRVRIDTRNSVNIDPALGRLLDALDPKTVKKLRFAIETRNQEDVDRILKDAETVQKKLDEIAKARAAANAEQKTEALANAARQNNDFENERKFLKDSLDFSVKSQAEGFRSGNQVRQDMAGIEARLLQSFKDEATVKGEVKKREDETFTLLKQQEDVEGKQLKLMQDQVTAQKVLQDVLGQSAVALEADRKRREEELASVRALFQELDKLKPGRDGIVTDDTLKNADTLLAKLKNGDKEFQFFDPTLLAQEIGKAEDKVTELHKLATAQRSKSDLEEARVALERQSTERIAAEAKIQAEIVALKQIALDKSAFAEAEGKKKQPSFTTPIVVLNDFGVVDFEATKEEQAKARIKAESAIAESKAAIQLAQRISAGALQQAKELEDSLAKLKEGNLGALGRDALERVDANAVAVLQNGVELKAQFEALQKAAQDFGFVLTKPFELTIRNEQAIGAIDTIKQKLLALQDAGQFQIEFKKVQAEGAKNFFHGGVVYGPNGIDAVPANLTAGETVIDAKNSSRFFNQLMQIRAGQAPTTANSSVNFGGININVSGTNSPQANARAIVDEIKRLKSRGLVEI